jgi:hypothetical protein
VFEDDDSVTVRLKFGDRFCGDDPLEWQKKHRAYFEHLRQSGFSVEEAVYCYFAADVFHDSPLRLEIDADKRVTLLHLRNVYAIDQLITHKVPEVDLSLFLTTIHCIGCKAVELAFDLSRDYWYQCAELSRLDGGVELLIGVSWDRGSGPIETIRIVAESIEVSDISPRLIERFGAVTPETLTPISESPAYYLQRPYFQLGKT